MKQTGYSLLLSLFLLLGASGFWFVGSATQHRLYQRDQTKELEQARVALISYAVNYIDHYGTQGAGVGHLPCPDTDSPDPTHQEPWIRDGPNPPCGRGLVEYGWLPRHVKTTTGRYHFHTRARQRLWYAVSGRFVNNPLNRSVNPDVKGDIVIGGFDDIVAVLTTPPLDAVSDKSIDWWNRGGNESTKRAFAIIRTKDIRMPAMQRVAEWLLSRLNAAMIIRCNTDDAAEKCTQAAHAKDHCDYDSEQTLLHWLSTKLPNESCDMHLADLLEEFSTFENIPYRRHWFIRNGWPAFVELEITEACKQVSAVDCEFALLHNSLSEQKIVFTLQPEKQAAENESI